MNIKQVQDASGETRFFLRDQCDVMLEYKVDHYLYRLLRTRKVNLIVEEIETELYYFTDESLMLDRLGKSDNFDFLDDLKENLPDLFDKLMPKINDREI